MVIILAKNNIHSYDTDLYVKAPEKNGSHHLCTSLRKSNNLKVVRISGEIFIFSLFRVI